jgi:hypothetical protein
MKKLFALACTLLLMAGVSIAQIRLDSLSKTSQNYKKSKTASPASKVALNPQPLPPGERKSGGDPASKVALNPQPLPPKQGKVGTTSAASKASLNPQPLPPGERKAGGDPTSKVALNPQPLPPKQGKVGSTSAASKVSLNPQPLPPKVGSTAMQKVSTSNKAGKKIMTPGAGARQ